MNQEWPVLFQEWFHTHYPTVRRKLVALVGDTAAAEDLAQEVFLRLYRNPPAEPGSIGAWLHRVAIRLGYDYLRGLRKDRRIEERSKAGVEVSPAAAPASEHEALRQLDIEQAQRILERMSPRDRAALLLRYSGYSYSEIAEALEVDNALVGSILQRAGGRFRKQFTEEGIPYESIQ